MDSKTYIANAIKTESVPASLEINPLALHAALSLMTSAAEIANQIKRKLYYGKDIEMKNIAAALGTVAITSNMLTKMISEDKANNRASFLETLPNLPQQLQDIKLENLNIRLLHSALGIFSESGEMLEALVTQFETGVLDGVNFQEEVGDTQWYTATACDELKADLDFIREVNIAKLKARFPNKFSFEQALNRDLESERAILENSNVSPDFVGVQL